MFWRGGGTSFLYPYIWFLFSFVFLVSVPQEHFSCVLSIFSFKPSWPGGLWEIMFFLTKSPKFACHYLWSRKINAFLSICVATVSSLVHNFSFKASAIKRDVNVLLVLWSLFIDQPFIQKYLFCPCMLGTVPRIENLQDTVPNSLISNDVTVFS